MSVRWRLMQSRRGRLPAHGVGAGCVELLQQVDLRLCKRLCRRRWPVQWLRLRLVQGLHLLSHWHLHRLATLRAREASASLRRLRLKSSLAVAATNNNTTRRRRRTLRSTLRRRVRCRLRRRRYRLLHIADRKWSLACRAVHRFTDEMFRCLESLPTATRRNHHLKTPPVARLRLR